MYENLTSLNSYRTHWIGGRDKERSRSGIHTAIYEQVQSFKPCIFFFLFCPCDTAVSRAACTLVYISRMQQHLASNIVAQAEMPKCTNVQQTRHNTMNSARGRWSTKSYWYQQKPKTWLTNAAPILMNATNNHVEWLRKFSFSSQASYFRRDLRRVENEMIEYCVDRLFAGILWWFLRFIQTAFPELVHMAFVGVFFGLWTI